VYRHTAGGPPTEGLYVYYDLGTELGKGSFATVRKAMSRATGKWYAVKMIQESKNVRSNGVHGHASRNATFAREISIMEKLKHPNICELVEVFFQENNDISMSFSIISTIVVSTLFHRSCPRARGRWRSAGIYPQERGTM
jgi:ser/thr/tyr protein kinase RAD53